MFNSIAKGIAKVFGTKADKDLKELVPFVELVNTEYTKLSSITDDQLRDKTHELKSEINEGLKSIDDKIAELHKRVDENPDLDITEKEEAFGEIDKLEEKRDEELEVILLKILPRAFAVIDCFRNNGRHAVGCQ